MSEFMFPTETIDLPSQGKFYPEGHPLRSGKIEIKYMTAKEEDILTSTNLLQKGIVLDKLMESIIVTKGVKPEDLITGDLNAITVATRILAYGKDYPIEVTCNSCRTKFDYTVDLSELKTIEPEEVSENGEYTVTLPTGVVITFKILTRGEEKKIVADVEAMKKINNLVESDTTTRLSYIITSVNGDRDKATIRSFVNAMIIKDVRAFREAYKKVSPDLNFDLEVSCSNCDSTVKVRMPFGANFFWPDLRPQG